MKTIILVFAVTVIFLIGMTKFNNDTAYNEAVRYAELSAQYTSINFPSGFEGGYEDKEMSFEVSFKGEVVSSKKVSISYGSTMRDAIEKAGGLTDNADEECINFDFVIVEDYNFYIPKIASGKVSINDATMEELQSLRGVGETIASKIIDYRVKVGSFNYLEELMSVNGIGESLFEYNKDKIKL